MKKLTMIIGILALIGLVAIPVMAWGPHWVRGHHMMGYYGDSPWYGSNYYSNMTSEQRSKLDILDREYYDETKELRDQVWAKSEELDSVLESTDPDLDKAKALQKEIRELRTKLDEKTLTYELESRKIVPDRQSGYGYGNRWGRHMGSYGYGMRFGSGYCWN